MIVGAPWYVANERLIYNLGIKTLNEEMKEKFKTYKDRL